MPLPHLGIVQPVRVCETCHEELNLAKNAKVTPIASTASPPGPTQNNRSMQPRSARIEDDDDKDLKLALQMSLEEVKRPAINPPSVLSQPKANTATQSVPQPRTDEGEDEDLKAAIAASLRDIEAPKGVQYPALQNYSQSPATQLAPTQLSTAQQAPTQQPVAHYQVFAC
jgi:hepatocyte growth factor-regulated tyrosine kinase substrate